MSTAGQRHWSWGLDYPGVADTGTQQTTVLNRFLETARTWPDEFLRRNIRMKK